MREFDVLILGAGASGLMLSALLKKQKRVALIEGNSQIGAKLLVSGGRRCNITNQNLNYKNYLGDGEFIKEILGTFNQKRLIKWLKYQGVELSLEKSSQLFCKNGSKAVIKLFEGLTKDINLFLEHKITSLKFEKDRFILSTNRGKFRAKAVVVATGGVSFPKLGASDIGFEIAKSFGHTIKTLSPALVGFTLQKEQFFMKDLSGISTLAEIKVADKSFRDNLLFAHRGISGPAILNSSLYWERGSIKVDFLPTFSLQNLNSKKQLSTILPLPKRASKAFLEHLKIKDKPYSNLNSAEFERLKLLKNYPLAPAGTFGFSKAEVTKGGVETDEVEPKSMMSRLQKNLFFTGEVLNVTGELGGYNLQWAFSSAYVCSRYLNSHLF